MSDRRQPRSSVLFGFYQQAYHFAGLKQEPFAHELMSDYRAQTPDDVQHIRCKPETTLSKQLAADQKRLSRYLHPAGDHLLPDDLEEFFVNRLPEPYRTECKRQLVRRYGSLYVPMTSATVSPDMALVSEVASTFGATMTAVAPTLADLVIDKNDLPHLRNAEEHIERLIGAAMALQHHLAAVRIAAEQESAGNAGHHTTL